MPDPNDLTRFSPQYGPEDSDLVAFYDLDSAEEITAYMRDQYYVDKLEADAEARAERRMR